MRWGLISFFSKSLADVKGISTIKAPRRDRRHLRNLPRTPQTTTLHHPRQRLLRVGTPSYRRR
jgi:hypothetical protein